MKTLFLAWQDPVERGWYPVGRLSFEGERFQFVYTSGARHSRFNPLGSMQDLEKRYQSTELFPLFANRILPKSRPEYRQILNWLDLNANQDDPLELLALTEGIRKTDTLVVFPCPEEQKDGTFVARFFSHGIRYLPDDSIHRISELKPGERLYLMHDMQNEVDPFAIAFRTGDPTSLVGYCPRYLSQDFRQVIADANEVEVSVERVNSDAPTQLRLLCSLKAPWPEEFRPCEGGDYAPLVD